MDPFQTLSNLTSPLSAKWCDFYYFLLLISLFMIFATLAKIIMHMLSSDKYKHEKIMNSAMMMISLIIQYFIARLTYSICIKSLGK